MSKILRRADVLRMLGVSHMTLWRWEKAGRFPRRIQLGQGSVGYLESEVEAWIAERAARREDA